MTLPPPQPRPDRTPRWWPDWILKPPSLNPGPLPPLPLPPVPGEVDDPWIAGQEPRT